MIITGSAIKKLLIKEINMAVNPVKAWSVMPPKDVTKFVIVDSLIENNEANKNEFLTSGTISVRCVEKFLNQSSNMDGVYALAQLIVQKIKPTTNARVKNVDAIRFVNLYFSDTTETILSVGNTITVTVSLRISYLAQKVLAS